MKICIDLPLPDEQVFRNGAADENLSIAANNPSEVFTNRELRRATDYGGPSTARVPELLVGLDLLIRQDRKTGRSISFQELSAISPARWLTMRTKQAKHQL